MYGLGIEESYIVFNSTTETYLGILSNRYSSSRNNKNVGMLYWTPDLDKACVYVGAYDGVLKTFNVCMFFAVSSNIRDTMGLYSSYAGLKNIDDAVSYKVMEDLDHFELKYSDNIFLVPYDRDVNEVDFTDMFRI